MLRPAWLLGLSRLQVETIVKTSGSNRFVGSILKTLVSLSLGRYFLRHRRTRRAWIRRFAEGKATPDDLVADVRAHFLDQHDVLDAWIERYAPRVRGVFLDRDTVHQRRIHIPMPVQLGEKTLPHLGAADLRGVFDRRGCLEIWGEGGSGKTSLACQVARWALADDPRDRLSPHRMLPVLVEPGFTFEVGDGQDPLREAIRGQLSEAADLADPIPQDLLEKLLRHRRVLVILDSLSEMDIETRGVIDPARSDFAAHALVVTSRRREDLRVRHTEVNPLVVDGTRLLSFFESYFAQSGRQDLFDNDEEVYSACQQLARMVGDRDATVLFARIFADQMIAQKMEGTDNVLDLPETLPDLMLRYLNELNRKVRGDHPENREVHAAAKIIAWECLRETFRPRPARLDTVDAALGGKERARPLLDHLERRLGIVKMIEPGWDQIRFTLDPLAEFLAGLHLVETWAGDDTCWREFLVAAKEAEGSPDSIREFLLAIRDCCRARGREHGVPARVEAALGEIVN